MGINYAMYLIFFFKVLPLMLFAFTNWTLFLTTWSVYLSFKAAQDKQNFGPGALTQKNEVLRIAAIRAQAKHQLLYSVVLIANFAVVVVYWTTLHKWAMEKYANENRSLG